MALIKRRQADFPSAADAARFRRLAALWKRDTLRLSSTTRIIMHPAYQRIIGMGPIALPLIFRELQQRPDWCFWALTSITGVNPVPPNARGSLHEMCAAWLGACPSNHHQPRGRPCCGRET